MAFHISCPLTCRRICDCELGFADGLKEGKAREEFLEEIEALEEFLRDPWSLRIGGGEEEGKEATVQVRVPRVVRSAAVSVGVVDGGSGEDRAKRAALQRQAAAASVAAEDYVRRLEMGAPDLELLGEAPVANAREDQGSSAIKIICRICFSGENEGSTKALKMLSCKTCDKKYHRSCLKSWAEYRDLFNWSSWACPSCRICEVCRRAGEPNKLMFCKRCDGAYHCYCQQPPHKNVSHGPYLCSKHTRCHSCGSTVPGNGPSTRWFLGYTCCDACGRLFVKGNYCPVCLKVYRDSETTPMVCCDICERWIHCACDGISDEKYQQFQVDQNLQYTCAACRGDCYQVKDTDDAVRELWKRKDEADHKLIASLRASAGMPSNEELVSASPYSDAELSGPKNDPGRSLKFSVKGLSNMSNKKESGNIITKNISPSKNYTKKTIKFVGNTKGSYQKNEERSLISTSKNHSFVSGTLQSSVDRSPYNEGERSSVYQVESNNYGAVKEFGVNNADMSTKGETERSKLQGLRFKQHTTKTESKNETVKGTKLVIHLGSRNINVSSSPRSETSSGHKEQEYSTSYGNEDSSQQKPKDRENHMHESRGGILRCDSKGTKFDNARLRRSSKHGNREGNVIKLGKVSSKPVNDNGYISEDHKEVETAGEGRSESDDDDDDDDVVLVRKEKQSTGPTNVKLQNDVGHHTSRLKFVSSAASDDLKPLLKLKFKNPYFEQRSSWAPRGEEENPIKGQRSKRKRPSMTEKVGVGGGEEGSGTHDLENPITDQEMDANWILQKLGKDAVGKRVEVHQSSDNSWCEGVVSDVTIQGGSTSSSSLLVILDNGRSTTLDLRKQAVRFASHKQKRAKTRS